MRRSLSVLSLVLGLWAAPGSAAHARAQSSLTLAEAVARARARHPAAGAAAAAEREAAQRTVQARAGLLPRVDVAESWDRGNQPVFVFGSLLGQRRFRASDFALDALNRPDPVDNIRTVVTVAQPIFDRSVDARVKAGRLDHAVAVTAQASVQQDLAARVADAYGRSLLAVAAQRSAAAAIETAATDRELAGNRRDAGLVTDADVLQLDVHLSRARAQQIRAAADERIARASLNALIGEPLDAEFVLDGGAVIESRTTDTQALQAEALANRADASRAALEQDRARAAVSAARAGFLPQSVAQGAWELNGSGWRAPSASWVVGAGARINLFRGFEDRARLAEAREHLTRTGLERAQTDTQIRLDVVTAIARVDAARSSVVVAEAAVAQALESQRIVRDRYAAGMTDVASLLRAAESVVQTETQLTAAHVAVLTESAAFARALGR